MRPHKYLRHSVRVTCLTLSALTLTLGAACQDPSYEAALQRRQANIQHLWEKHLAMEQVRPMNLENLRITTQKLEALYAQRLKESIRTIEQRLKSDNARWLVNEEVRRKQFEKLFLGNADPIPEIWHDMTD